MISPWFIKTSWICFPAAWVVFPPHAQSMLGSALASFICTGSTVDFMLGGAYCCCNMVWSLVTVWGTGAKPGYGLRWLFLCGSISCSKLAVHSVSLSVHILTGRCRIVSCPGPVCLPVIYQQNNQLPALVLPDISDSDHLESYLAYLKACLKVYCR